MVYELHVGTFTPEGTLDAAIDRLDHLVELGVDLVEVMPVNAFNGDHGWGYDGTAWFAVHEPYGGPAAYQRFVDACHQRGLGVVQDVVYNHLGPSGNYLPVFGPYLSSEGSNPWGDHVNLDGEGVGRGPRLRPRQRARCGSRTSTSTGCGSTPCTRSWTRSATHLLEEMGQRVAALSAHHRRPLTLIAEWDGNDTAMVTPREAGGTGLDAQWSDDFHHAVHVALTGETQGYYADFEPLSALAKVIEKGFFHDGTFSSFRGADHGKPVDVERMPAWRLVVCNQNHDQVGNRARGDRLTEALDDDQLAAAALLTLAGSVHPDALPGRGVGGVDAVRVLHLPPRGRPRPRGERGTQARVREDGVGHRDDPRPPGPGDVHRLQARLERGRRRAPRGGAGGLPVAGRAATLAARAHRPRHDPDLVSRTTRRRAGSLMRRGGAEAAGGGGQLQ